MKNNVFVEHEFEYMLLKKGMLYISTKNGYVMIKIDKNYIMSKSHF